jgi:hypothetical protein
MTNAEPSKTASSCCCAEQTKDMNRPGRMKRPMETQEEEEDEERKDEDGIGQTAQGRRIILDDLDVL